MRELRSEEVGDRRVALIEMGDERYSVTIVVRGPEGTWEDIICVLGRLAVVGRDADIDYQ